MPPHPSDLLAGASCSQWCWSVLGPHGTGNRQSWAGVSGHDGWEESQVGEPFMAMTWAAQAPRGWVRTPRSHSPSRQRADSNNDSNRGEPLWSTARCGVEGVQVADAYERL
jgi:hypothetical protein